jgi:hypothetical protein
MDMLFARCSSESHKARQIQINTVICEDWKPITKPCEQLEITKNKKKKKQTNDVVSRTLLEEIK